MSRTGQDDVCVLCQLWFQTDRAENGILGFLHWNKTAKDKEPRVTII